MRKLLFLLLVVSFAWEIGDEVCNRSAGESCMNSPDCEFCMLNLSAGVSYSETEAVLWVEIENLEPEEVPVIVYIKEVEKEEPLVEKAVDLKPMKKTRIEKKIERTLENRTFLIKIIDRELGTAWSQKEVALLGLEQSRKVSNPVMAIIGVLSFFTVLYFGIKGTRKEISPYFFPPVYTYTPPPSLSPKEEIIVVAKKKKYYYRKR